MGRGIDLDDEIAELEQRLSRKRAELAAKRIVAVPRDCALVCTRQQEGLWFEHQLDPASTVYHIPVALRLRGALDETALHRALHALVTRHEALRTRFVGQDGLPRQIIDPAPADLPLPAIDIPADAVNTWVTEQIRRPLDLATGPVFRTALARLAPDEHVLVLVAHHIVADGWSVGILTSELTRLYAAMTGITTQAQLPDLAVQPADHAAWQRRWLAGEELQRQLDHWRTTLANLPTLEFPTDRPRPAQPTGAGARIDRSLPDNLSAAANRYARDNHVSFLAIHQAALLTVLHRYTGQTDLPIGSIFSGRTHTDIEPLVGYFANTVVLRTDLDGDPTFADLIHRCHETVLEASAHQDIPFSLIVDTLQPDRIPGRNPLFQISLTLQPARSTPDLTLGTLTADPIDAATSNARFDLAIDIDQTPDGHLAISTEYSTQLFAADRIDRLLDHYTAALANGLARPDRPATEIEVMPAAERHRVVRAWNDTAAGYHAEPLHRLVEAAAARTPDAVAVVDHDGTHHTYRELDTAADRLAHALRRHGVGPDVRVGVCLERGADLVTALLATWKAGGAYLPLDPELPPERVAFMLADATPAVVVTHAAHALGFPSAIALDTERQAIAAEPAIRPDGGAGSDDAAYVLYTSGSTGAPKGVKVPHCGVHNRIAWMQDTYRLEPTDRVLQKTPYGFDVSVWEFFWPLVTGATLVIAAPGGHRDPDYLYRLIVGQNVTTVHFVPTMLRSFLDTVPDRGPLGRVRRVFCSGEALPANSVRRFLAAWPDVELHNLYGPTEASIDVTAWRCEPDAAVVPIGRPIANTRTYVLDAWLRPAPIGIPGELFLAGTGLAHGYLNRPGLTVQSFLPDPYGPPGQRMYATGDLARWRADGALEYLGRTDRQVKLRGQRIELGEIEHAMLQHPDIRQSAVTVRDNALVGYVVGDADLDDVRRFLADRLPTYMIPTALVVLPEMPISPNGKLDTARLPAPATATAEYVAPRGDTERWLATVWGELLEVDLVGARDNFFDLGGNSLHATRLVARVRDQLDLEIHLQHLFTSPTLGQLAGRIDQARDHGNDHIRDGHDDGAAPTRTDVIALRPGGTRPPLFLVHPGGGSVTAYARLAPLLGDDQPVYAIEDPALYGATPHDSLVERARRYADLVRRVQPAGPYHVGGWSLGGLIGLEMARELTGAGEKVALVVALDSSPPLLPSHPSDVDLLTAFVHDLAGAADVAPPDIDFGAYGGWNRDALAELTLDRLADAGLAPAELRDELRVRMEVFAANLRAMASHRMRRYGGRVAVIRAAEEPRAGNHLAWRALVADLVQHTVPGNHFTMLAPPHLSTLAATLREVLR